MQLSILLSGSALLKPGITKSWPEVVVISRGYLVNTKETKRLAKRKWKEILSTASNPTPVVLMCRPAVTFSDQGLPLRKPNKYVPLVISSVMLGIEVKRILVDQGSSVDIIFTDLLDILKIVQPDLTPYQGSDLFDFNRGRARPLGNVQLMVTFGNKDLSRTIQNPVSYLKPTSN